MKRGAYSVTWNGADDHGRSLANGVYFVRLTAGDYRATEKVVLQK
jgi:flagellar hook assembly protein FlgD